jgi:hypothetical protein
MFGEGTKCGATRLGFAFFDSPGVEIGIQTVQTVGKSLAAALVQRHAIRKDPVPEKIHAVPGAIEEGFDFELKADPIQFRAEPGQH